MRKLHLFLIILVITAIVLLGVYAAYEPSRQPLEDFFVPLGQSAYAFYLTASTAFMAIPGWPYLGAGIVLVIGYLLGHYNQVWWLRLKWWGHKETMAPLYQQQPQFQPAIPPASTSQPIAEPPTEEIEAQ